MTVTHTENDSISYPLGQFRTDPNGFQADPDSFHHVATARGNRLHYSDREAGTRSTLCGHTIAAMRTPQPNWLMCLRCYTRAEQITWIGRHR